MMNDLSDLFILLYVVLKSTVKLSASFQIPILWSTRHGVASGSLESTAAIWTIPQTPGKMPPVCWLHLIKRFTKFKSL